MKKKTKITVSIIIIAALFVLCSVIWWFSPKHFLKNVKADEISCIEVFNGNDGNRFTITDKNDISFILENIKSVSMGKDSIALGMGTTYNLRFMNSSGDEIDKFIIMSPETIKSGIVLYECKGELQQVEDYLIKLESIQFPDTDWIEGQN